MYFCQWLFYRFDEFDEAIEEAIEEDIKEAEGGGETIREEEINTNISLSFMQTADTNIKKLIYGTKNRHIEEMSGCSQARCFLLFPILMLS